jgi:hypothetical protein
MGESERLSALDQVVRAAMLGVAGANLSCEVGFIAWDIWEVYPTNLSALELAILVVNNRWIRHRPLLDVALTLVCAAWGLATVVVRWRAGGTAFRDSRWGPTVLLCMGAAFLMLLIPTPVSVRSTVDLWAELAVLAVLAPAWRHAVQQDEASLAPPSALK